MDFSSILTNAAWEIINPNTAAYALAALGLALHFGFSGLLNFGQAGFMAVGAYAFAVSVLTFDAPLWAAVLVSLAASLGLALVLGLPTLRLRADYLAIVTIAAAEIIRYVVTTNQLTEYTGAANGLAAFERGFYALSPIPPGQYAIGPLVVGANQLWAIIVAWALVVLTGAVLALLVRSPWGRVLKGIREDEDAVRSLGKNVYLYKMQALMIGGLMGTLGGLVFVLGTGSVQPARFGTELTFFLWTCLLLGGMTTIIGPVVGAMLFWIVLSLTQGILVGLVESGTVTIISTVQAGQLRYIMVGVALMLLMIFRPQGIFGNRKELVFS
ncbi:branched-chain amino acid ABC transporter permease [Brevibacterium salitolerans]|jgi:neutral amino acid transport system permease protein|uniref:Branched-chain amino acid ABC transporter permease n=1 Tax=Brevibacterium salitolerans TaxID=1403566 RepID=A0ABN2WFG4_9MICO